MKKSLSLSSKGILLIGSIFAIAGCGQPTPSFTINSALKTNTQTEIQKLITNLYNQLNRRDLATTDSGYATRGNYTVAEANAILTNDITYYVNFGVINDIDEINTITIGGVTYQKDDTVDLSVGKSCFISDKVFYVVDDELYVAAPIVNFSSVNDHVFKINDESFDFHSFEIVCPFQFSSISWEESSTNTIERVGTTDVYNVVINETSKMLNFYYTGATVDDVIMTAKKLGNGSISYGLTKVESSAGNPYAIYLAGYGYSDEQISVLNNQAFKLDIFVLGKGIASVMVKLSIPTN